MRMQLVEARKIADEIIESLRPYCERIEVAGSIRRGKREVKDIELVCEPRGVIDTGDLFGGRKIRPPQFVEIVDSYKWLKGDARDGKYFQRLHPSGIVIDIFTATLKNWGLIYAIRTGSSAFSHQVLAKGWVKAGYKSIYGYLYNRRGQEIPIWEEEDLFNLIGVDYIEPEAREIADDR
jgi:DNA polymerase/3'-5' exonuclease PolX